MIRSHATGTKSTERHIVLGNVKIGAIYSDTTGTDTVGKCVDSFLVGVKIVRAQRCWPGVNVIKDIIHIIVGHNRKDWSKDFFLHHLHLISGIKDQMERKL